MVKAKVYSVVPWKIFEKLSLGILKAAWQLTRLRFRTTPSFTCHGFSILVNSHSSSIVRRETSRTQASFLQTNNLGFRMGEIDLAAFTMKNRVVE